MKVVIIGAGGLGGKFGALLGEHAEVWLIHHRKEHVEAINEKGVLLRREGQDRTVKTHAALNPAEAGIADVLCYAALLSKKCIAVPTIATNPSRFRLFNLNFARRKVVW